MTATLGPALLQALEQLVATSTIKPPCDLVAAIDCLKQFFAAAGPAAPDDAGGSRAAPMRPDQERPPKPPPPGGDKPKGKPGKKKGKRKRTDGGLTPQSGGGGGGGPCDEDAANEAIRRLAASDEVQRMVAQGYRDPFNFTTAEHQSLVEDVCQLVTDGVDVNDAARRALFGRMAGSGSSATTGPDTTGAGSGPGARPVTVDGRAIGRPRRRPSKPKRPCPAVVREQVYGAYRREARREGTIRVFLNPDHRVDVPPPPPEVKAILDRMSAKLCELYTTADTPPPIDDAFIDLVDNAVRQAVVFWLHGQGKYAALPEETARAKVVKAIATGADILETAAVFAVEAPVSFARLVYDVFKLMQLLSRLGLGLTFYRSTEEAMPGVTWAQLQADLWDGDGRVTEQVLNFYASLLGKVPEAIADKLEKLGRIVGTKNKTVAQKQELMETIFKTAHAIAGAYQAGKTLSSLRDPAVRAAAKARIASAIHAARHPLRSTAAGVTKARTFLNAPETHQMIAQGLREAYTTAKHPIETAGRIGKELGSAAAARGSAALARARLDGWTESNSSIMSRRNPWSSGGSTRYVRRPRDYVRKPKPPSAKSLRTEARELRRSAKAARRRVLDGVFPEGSETTVARMVDHLSDEVIEHGLVLDGQGEVVWNGTEHLPDRVTIPDSAARNRHVWHNHPKRPNGHTAGGFTPEDMRVAATQHVASENVIDGEYIYTMRLAPGTEWPHPERILLRHRDNMQRSMDELLNEIVVDLVSRGYNRAAARRIAGAEVKLRLSEVKDQAARMTANEFDQLTYVRRPARPTYPREYGRSQRSPSE